MLFLDASEKFLSLICFANNLYALYNRLNTSRLAQFRKTMKICESVKRNTLSLISKATFTKTAINPKFIDGFSLENLSAAIDQCTTKSPNFVSIENFLSCTNIRAKLSKYCSNFIDLAKFLLWDFLLYRTTSIPMQHARIYCAWLPSECYGKGEKKRIQITEGNQAPLLRFFN